MHAIFSLMKNQIFWNFLTLSVFLILSFSFSLLFPLISPLSSPIKLQDSQIPRVLRDSSSSTTTILPQLFKDDYILVQRKMLHEVHSGPNPIGNSVPHPKNTTLQSDP
ncbi:uncharacterized protein LOC120070632 [Benincasa hispida]|uniref:uncharacterized protein LOC120070632 n=1 Tax=Benincasa hispida TaxID=102211 RepID=UPI0018FF7F88|nr:uncharacterized protein LOC120070632 [Benincasa hispida]